MNPSAGEWKPSASATEFTPSSSAPPPTQQTQTAPPSTQSSSSSGIDESDPLWQLVLTKICNGDRDRATKLINNPDSLTQYPEGEFFILYCVVLMFYRVIYFAHITCYYTQLQ